MINLRILLYCLILISSCSQNKEMSNTGQKFILNNSLKKEIIQYGNELRTTFGEIPLNIVVDISQKNEDTLIIRFSSISKTSFMLHTLEKKILFNERVQGINYYYINESASKYLHSNEIIPLNFSNKKYDIYFYAREIYLKEGDIIKKQNIDPSQIKWLNPLPPSPSLKHSRLSIP